MQHAASFSTAWNFGISQAGIQGGECGHSGVRQPLTWRPNGVPGVPHRRRPASRFYNHLQTII
jgi:hypothetical protein